MLYTHMYMLYTHNMLLHIICFEVLKEQILNTVTHVFLRWSIY